jgi:hypothetical protein
LRREQSSSDQQHGHDTETFHPKYDKSGMDLRPDAARAA